MGTRFHLGLVGVALVATLGGCGRAAQQSDQATPDTTELNASAALVETPVESHPTAGRSRPPKAVNRAGDCLLSDVSGFVGKPDNPATRGALAAAAGRRAVRWIKPGTAVTQDMQPGRINAIVGDDGRIDSLRCG